MGHRDAAAGAIAEQHRQAICGQDGANLSRREGDHRIAFPLIARHAGVPGNRDAVNLAQPLRRCR